MVSPEWREVEADLGCFVAPKGLKNLAQGFNPGNYQVRRFALKGREITILVRRMLWTHSIWSPFRALRRGDTVPRVETLG